MAQDFQTFIRNMLEGHGLNAPPVRVPDARDVIQSVNTYNQNIPQQAPPPPPVSPVATYAPPVVQNLPQSPVMDPRAFAAFQQQQQMQQAQQGPVQGPMPVTPTTTTTPPTTEPTAPQADPYSGIWQTVEYHAQDGTTYFIVMPDANAHTLPEGATIVDNGTIVNEPDRVRTAEDEGKNGKRGDTQIGVLSQMPENVQALFSTDFSRTQGQTVIPTGTGEGLVPPGTTQPTTQVPQVNAQGQGPDEVQQQSRDFDQLMQDMATTPQNQFLAEQRNSQEPLTITQLAETNPEGAALLRAAGITTIRADQMAVQYEGGQISLVPANDTPPPGATIITYGGNTTPPSSKDATLTGLSWLMEQLERPQREAQSLFSRAADIVPDPIQNALLTALQASPLGVGQSILSGDMPFQGSDVSQTMYGFPAFAQWLQENPDIAGMVEASGYNGFTGQRAVWERFQADRNFFERSMDTALTDPLNAFPSMGAPVRGVAELVGRRAVREGVEMTVDDAIEIAARRGAENVAEQAPRSADEIADTVFQNAPEDFANAPNVVEQPPAVRQGVGPVDESLPPTNELVTGPTIPTQTANVNRGLQITSDVLNQVANAMDIPEDVLGAVVSKLIEGGGRGLRLLGDIPMGDGRQLGDLFRETDASIVREEPEEIRTQLDDFRAGRQVDRPTEPTVTQPITPPRAPQFEEITLPNGQTISVDINAPDADASFSQASQATRPQDTLAVDRPVADLGRPADEVVATPESPLAVDRPIEDVGEAAPIVEEPALARDAEFRETPVGKQTEEKVSKWPDWMRPQSSFARRVGDSRVGSGFVERPVDIARIMAPQPEMTGRWQKFLDAYDRALNRKGTGYIQREDARKARTYLDAEGKPKKGFKHFESASVKGQREDGRALSRTYEVLLEANNSVNVEGRLFNAHFGDVAEIPEHAWKRWNYGGAEHTAMDTLEKSGGSYVPGTDLAEAVELAIFHPVKKVRDDALDDIRFRLSQRDTDGSLKLTQGGSSFLHRTLKKDAPELEQIFSTAKNAELSIPKLRQAYEDVLAANKAKANPDRLTVADARSLSDQTVDITPDEARQVRLPQTGEEGQDVYEANFRGEGPPPIRPEPVVETPVVETPPPPRVEEPTVTPEVTEPDLTRQPWLARMRPDDTGEIPTTWTREEGFTYSPIRNDVIAEPDVAKMLSENGMNARQSALTTGAKDPIRVDWGRGVNRYIAFATEGQRARWLRGQAELYRLTGKIDEGLKANAFDWQGGRGAKAIADANPATPVVEEGADVYERDLAASLAEDVTETPPARPRRLMGRPVETDGTAIPTDATTPVTGVREGPELYQHPPTPALVQRQNAGTSLMGRPANVDQSAIPSDLPPGQAEAVAARQSYEDAIHSLVERRAAQRQPIEEIIEPVPGTREGKRAEYLRGKSETRAKAMMDRSTPLSREDLDSFYVRGRSPSATQARVLGQRFTRGDTILERWDQYVDEYLQGARSNPQQPALFGASSPQANVTVDAIAEAEEQAAKRVVGDYTVEILSDSMRVRYEAELRRALKETYEDDLTGEIRKRTPLDAQITALHKTLNRTSDNKLLRGYDRIMSALRKTFLYNWLTGPRYIATQIAGNAISAGPIARNSQVMTDILSPDSLRRAYRTSRLDGELPDSVMDQARGDYGLGGTRELTKGSLITRDQTLDALDNAKPGNSLLGKWIPFIADKRIRQMSAAYDQLARESLWTHHMDNNMLVPRSELRSRVLASVPNGVDAAEVRQAFDALPQRFSSSDFRDAFSPFDAKWADRHARDWQEALTKTDMAARAEVKRVYFGGTERNADVALKRVLMFHYWTSRALPLYTEAIARNPVFLYNFMKMLEETGDDSDLSGTKFYKMMQTPMGYNLLIRPDAFFATFASIWEDAGYEPDGESTLGKILRKSPMMLNPLIMSSLNIAGVMGQTFAPDPVGANKWIQLGQAAVDNLNAQFGWGLPPVGNIQEKTLREVRDFVSGFIDPALPDAVQDYVPYMDEMAYKDNEVRSIVAEIALERGMSLEDPVVQTSMTDPESELYQEAMKKYALQDAADIALRIIPVTSVLYPKSQLASPKERTLAIEAEKQSQQDAGMQQPTPRGQELMTERDTIAAASDYSRTIQQQQDEYRQLGSPEARGAWAFYNNIKYGSLEQSITVSGQEWAAGDVAALEDSQREALADTWATEAGVADLITEVQEQRKAYRESHPEYAEYTTWSAQANDYEGGVQQWAIDTAAGNPNYARWLNELPEDRRADDQALTSLQAYMAYRADKMSYWENEPLANRSAVDPTPYNAIDAGTGDGLSSTTTSQQRGPTEEGILESYAQYEADMAAYNAAASQMLGQEVNVDWLNPQAKSAVEYNLGTLGFSKPSLGGYAADYLQWVNQQGSGDTSIPAFLRWYAQMNPQNVTQPTPTPVSP